MAVLLHVRNSPNPTKLANVNPVPDHQTEFAAVAVKDTDHRGSNGGQMSEVRIVGADPCVCPPGNQ